MVAIQAFSLDKRNENFNPLFLSGGRALVVICQRIKKIIIAINFIVKTKAKNYQKKKKNTNVINIRTHVNFIQNYSDMYVELQLKKKQTKSIKKIKGKCVL